MLNNTQSATGQQNTDLLYKLQFGQDFELGFDLSAFPKLDDYSFGHDVCPNFVWKGKTFMQLWVNNVDVSDREIPSMKRYTVLEHDVFSIDDVIEDGTQKQLLCTDSVDELVAFLKKHAI